MLTDTIGTDIHVVFRSAKVTPTKAGRCYPAAARRGGSTRPYTADDGVDEIWIAAETKHGDRFFKFPAHEFAKSGVLATDKKPGKRGFASTLPGHLPQCRRHQGLGRQREFFTVLSR